MTGGRGRLCFCLQAEPPVRTRPPDTWNAKASTEYALAIIPASCTVKSSCFFPAESRRQLFPFSDTNTLAGSFWWGGEFPMVSTRSSQISRPEPDSSGAGAPAASQQPPGSPGHGGAGSGGEGSGRARRSGRQASSSVQVQATPPSTPSSRRQRLGQQEEAGTLISTETALQQQLQPNAPAGGWFIITPANAYFCSAP